LETTEHKILTYTSDSGNDI